MRTLLFICLLALFVSCNSKKKQTIEEVLANTEQEETQISRIGVTLSSMAQKDMQTWVKYQNMRAMVERYQRITKSEALQNALELSELILDASDTIEVAMVDKPEVQMRFHVLYNQAFRLNDMADISSITKEEVEVQVTNILDAYSSLNDKINVLYKIDQFKRQYKEGEDIPFEIQQPVLKDGRSLNEMHKRTSNKKTPNERLEAKKGENSRQ
ncbi:hypothetical protein [Urechidicola sp. KH5]